MKQPKKVSMFTIRKSAILKALWPSRGGSSWLCVTCQLLLLISGCVARKAATLVDENELSPQLPSNGVFPGEEDVLEGRSRAVTQTQSKGRAVDPHASWISFVQHSSKTSREQKKCKNRRKNDRLIGLPGAQGPPGPMGPRGPAGAVLTKEEILTEFRTIIREAAERRAQILVYEKCPSCANNITEATQPWLPEVEDLLLTPIVPVAFHCKLQSDLRISGRDKVEITHYQTDEFGGLFKRGSGLDVTVGRFTAPRTAIYQFSANVHIRHRRAGSSTEDQQPADGVPRRKEYIRLTICVNSLCEAHASLEFISGFESTSRIFTISVSGLLTLELGQYASVFIDNKSTQKVYIQAGSDFSGLMMGA